MQTPPELHSSWEPTSDRPDPIALIEQQSATRDPDLVPVRYAQMMTSPYAFYCAGARIMASDLAATPTAGLMTQLCGDAHLSNFGVFAAPQSHPVFDIREFDETLAGPFEYDVKRLATSVIVAARHNGMSRDECGLVTSAAVHAYRTAMAEFAQMGVLELWNARITDSEITKAVDLLAGRGGADDRDHTWERGTAPEVPSRVGWADAQRSGDALRDAPADSFREVDTRLRRLFGHHDRTFGGPRIANSARGQTQRDASRDADRVVHEQMREFKATLRGERRHLVERFRVIDAARACGSTGSIDSWAYIVLMEGRDERDLLMLQLKEATASVLEDHLPRSRYRNAGERVVRGQRMLQAAADIFLGWTKGIRTNRSYYVRQLAKIDGFFAINPLPAAQLNDYASLCAKTLARAHARSGDPIAIAVYLGDRDDFDHAITRFAERYADQNDQDYEAFTDAAHAGRIVVEAEPL